MTYGHNGGKFARDSGHDAAVQAVLQGGKFGLGEVHLTHIRALSAQRTPLWHAHDVVDV